MGCRMKRAGNRVHFSSLRTAKRFHTKQNLVLLPIASSFFAFQISDLGGFGGFEGFFGGSIHITVANWTPPFKTSETSYNLLCICFC